jgi:hypothetical protein
MPGGSTRLSGLTGLKPLRQGNLSRLCGLYSLLNGIQLALYPERLPKPQLEELYLHAVGHLARRRQLKHVLGIGMSEDIWLQLATALVQHVGHIRGTSLIIKPILTGIARRSLPRAFHAITRTISSGSPVLVGLGGSLEHYSVIAGYTDKRLLLFDSSGFRWLEINSVGLSEGSSHRHWLSPDGVIAIIDDW